MSGLNRGPLQRALVLVAVTAALLGSSTTLASQQRAAAQAKMGGTITIDNVSGSLWSCGFNPYGASTAFLSAGILYEPLWYVNPLNSSTKAWLASSYHWGNGNKTLTFTIRRGVKWTDGKALTPADVAFTFNLMKRFDGLDLNAVWTVLSSVKVQGNNVVFTFKSPSVPYFYYIADQSFIVPQHIWSKIANPVTFTDKNPVATGPFKLGKCTPQNIEYVRNPHYWQAGKPYVSKVEYPAFMGNQAGNLYLAQGKAQWGGQFIPNVKSYYLNRDPKNRHAWYPAVSGDVALYPNLKAWPTSLLAVRKAISYGIDRAKASRLGVYGYLPPANQTGIVLPTWKNWFDSAQAAKFGNYSFSVSKAVSILQHAGFTKGSDGIFKDKKGRRLSMSILNTGGFTDWVAEVNLIQQSLKQVGIEVKPVNLSGDTHTAREEQGQFQLGYDQPSGGPEPYYLYHQWLYSANSAPIGKTASSDYERFSSANVDSWLNAYAKTTSPSVQHTLVKKIQGVMLSQLPVIPVLESISWYQYDTTHFTGWPTPSNPYANPAPYASPDWEVILSSVHLK